MQAFAARPPPLTTGPDGVIRVSGTRVSLETIVAAFDTGSTAEEIAQQYPSSDLASIYGVLSWVLDNRPAIEGYVASRSAEARALQARIESDSPPGRIRERLLARRSAARG